jgi:hypothetical protein
MTLNIPVVALAVAGVVLVIAGVFAQNSFTLVLFGLLTIQVAWILQEMTKRRA